MDEIERRERPRLRARERLRTDDPRCCFCGEDNPHCLERHHIAGQAYADDTLIVCRNCHRKLTVRRRMALFSRGRAIQVTVLAEPASKIGAYMDAVGKF